MGWFTRKTLAEEEAEKQSKLEQKRIDIRRLKEQICEDSSRSFLTKTHDISKEKDSTAYDLNQVIKNKFGGTNSYSSYSSSMSIRGIQSAVKAIVVACLTLTMGFYILEKMNESMIADGVAYDAIVEITSILATTTFWISLFIVVTFTSALFSAFCLR